MIFSKKLTIQGHRGARGLLPENTIESCCLAVQLGVDGLEIDVVVSKDQQIIVSHDPWMNPLFCTFPNGRVVDTEGVFLKNLSASDIQKYDCGSRGNPLFLTQKPVTSYKPTLSELISSVDKYAKQHNLKKIFWNIEVKSHPKWYGRLVPTPPVFVRLLEAPLSNLPKNEFYISSFDPFLLQEVRRKMPNVNLAFLSENRKSLAANIRNLGFKPTIYSPYFKFLNKYTVQKAHQQGIKIITWTVNDKQNADMLRDWKVDGLITDYPALSFSNEGFENLHKLTNNKQ